MGRITVFVTDGNAACTRTLAVFQSRKIPITIINLSKFPGKRNDMIALCMAQSTPQVFFNTRYIGGTEETLALLSEWSASCTESATLNRNTSVTSKSSDGSNNRNVTSKYGHSQRNSTGTDLSGSRHSTQSSKQSCSTTRTYGSVYERYMAEIGNFHDPTNKRLSMPLDAKPILDKAPLPRDPKMEYCIKLPGDKSTVLEMTQMFLDLIKFEETNIDSTTYHKSFFGGTVIKILAATFEINEKKAHEIASQLLSIGLYVAINSPPSSGISFDSDALYRLQCHNSPSILNSFRLWTERVDSNPLCLIHHLIMKFNDIEINATDSQGILHPSRVKKSNEYTEFEERMCELQGVNMSQMNDRMKIVRTIFHTF